jgi:hypothetical protein
MQDFHHKKTPQIFGKNLEMTHDDYLWRHDTQHNDTQHNDTQQKALLFVTLKISDTQHKNDALHNNGLPLC